MDNVFDDENRLEIRIKAVLDAVTTVKVIKAMRVATGLSIVEIKRALVDRTPLTVAYLYGINHHESEQTVNSLFDALETSRIEFEIILDGDIESRLDFNNAMQRWHDIGFQTAMMSDLESGTPCIETLEWLRSTGSVDLFQQTIRNIMDADNSNMDVETLDWIKHQLNG